MDSGSADAQSPGGDRAAVKALSDHEIIELIGRGRTLRRAALLELIDRARTDAHLVQPLADLAEDPRLREDRLFHLVSMAWVAIIGLLGIETRGSRAAASRAFAALDARDQELLLGYLRVERLEDAHPDRV
ncbi:hypothetical protein [Catellatospora methionotrophica]|uniref:hypothetical protein n=1 Tax=Catellatospora methionotrophica TaxID=121620 RepID=UPI0033D5C2B6